MEQSGTGGSSAQRTEQMKPVGEVHNSINIAMGGAGSSSGDWMQTIFGYAGNLLSIMLSLFYLIYHFVLAPKNEKRANVTEPEQDPEHPETAGQQEESPSADWIEPTKVTVAASSLAMTIISMALGLRGEKI